MKTKIDFSKFDIEVESLGVKAALLEQALCSPRYEAGVVLPRLGGDVVQRQLREYKQVLFGMVPGSEAAKALKKNIDRWLKSQRKDAR